MTYIPQNMDYGLSPMQSLSILVCPLEGPYDVFVDWDFFSMSTPKSRFDWQPYQTRNVFWKIFLIWIGQLKVMMIHDPVSRNDENFQNQFVKTWYFIQVFTRQILWWQTTTTSDRQILGCAETKTFFNLTSSYILQTSSLLTQ